MYDNRNSWFSSGGLARIRSRIARAGATNSVPATRAVTSQPQRTSAIAGARPDSPSRPTIAVSIARPSG